MDLTWRRDKLIILPVPRIEPRFFSIVSPIAQSLYRLHPLGPEVAVRRFRFYSGGAVDGTSGLSALLWTDRCETGRTSPPSSVIELQSASTNNIRPTYVELTESISRRFSKLSISWCQNISNELLR
jgi:hypothetical protein